MKAMQDLQMLQWKLYKEQNIASILMSSQQAQNECLNYAFKWEDSKDLKEVHLLMNSMLSSKDINLIMLQIHQDGLTQKIYQRLYWANNIRMKL